MGRDKKLNTQKNLGARFLLFLLFIFLVNSWSLHHLGSKFTHFLIANGPLVLVAIANFFSPLFKKQEARELKEIIRGWFLFFISPTVLIILFALFFVLGSFFSSITVMSSGIQNTITITVDHEGRQEKKSKKKIKNTSDLDSEEESQDKLHPKLKGPNDVKRIIKFTTPFGHPYFLKAKGYLRYSFDLYPWIGKKIRVSKDLTISPSILIRVPAAARVHLSKGKIVVLSNDNIIAEINTNETLASIIVGHYFLSPNEFNEFIGRWKMELTGENIEGPPAARCLLAWQQPHLIQPCIPMTPGIILEAKFFITEEKPIARAKFRVGYEKIQDISLLMGRR